MIQHAVEALALQQEVRRLPVVPGRLHAHLGDLPAAQPVRQLQQALTGGPELPGLLLPPAAAGVGRHPDRDHDLLLADIDPGDPFGEQWLVLHLFHRELL